MIYNAGSNYPSAGGNFGGITLSGNGTFSLGAPTSGADTGILIFQSRQNTRAMSFSGSAMAGMGGIIYAPNALLSMSGNAALANPLIVGTLNLSGNVSLTQTVSGGDATDDAVGLANTLIAGNLSVYIDDPSGLFNAGELARIQDAINTWDALLAPHSVTITQVSDPGQANLVIDTGSTSACGGAAQGVLGCFNSQIGEITLLQGWNWYAGADPSQIGASQYDLQTTVTHELGHAIGLGHSQAPTSPMYATLAAGMTERAVSVQDLNIPDPPAGADPQMAAGFQDRYAPSAGPVTVGAATRSVNANPVATSSTLFLTSIPTSVAVSRRALILGGNQALSRGGRITSFAGRPHSGLTEPDGTRLVDVALDEIAGNRHAAKRDDQIVARAAHARDIGPVGSAPPNATKWTRVRGRFLCTESADSDESRALLPQRGSKVWNTHATPAPNVIVDEKSQLWEPKSAHARLAVAVLAAGCWQHAARMASGKMRRRRIPRSGVHATS
jgi:hypothetical protein